MNVLAAIAEGVDDDAVETRRIVIVAFDDCQSLDVVGPAEVFAAAGRRGAYRIQLTSPAGGLVRTQSIVSIDTEPLAGVRGPIDTLIVGGGPGARRQPLDPALLHHVRRLSRRARRVTSVCTGALVLGAAGLLDGKRATTHWSALDELSRRHPDVHVERDPIFVRDGDVWTSAGVTAGIDLSLALVTDDLGAPVAAEIARWLVMFVQRPGGQAQFSAQLSVARPTRPSLQELHDWLPGHLTADLSVDALARRVGLSPRQFARLFRTETGRTPAAHVEDLRIERAKQLLATTDLVIATVARRCGFGTVETLHRAFRRVTGVTPDQYRRRFGAA